MHKIAALGGAVLAAALTGCANGPFAAWNSPPSLAEQRASAQRFDPYTEDEVGPPVVGGRPREFQEPIAEPSRARWDLDEWNRRHGGGF